MTISLSDRAAQVAPSATLAISAKAAELRANGIDIINMSTGEPDATSPRRVLDAAIDAVNAGHTHYTPVDGIKPLKEAIITKYKRDNNLDYNDRQIMVSTGAKQALYNICQAVLNDGDEAIIPAPYWVSYPAMVQLAGGVPVVIKTTSADQFKISAAQLEAAITPKTKLLFLCSPSNPSGMIYSKEALAAIGEVLLKHPNIVVVSDDLYEHVRWDDNDFYNIVNACPALYDRTLVVNGVSKVYAMTGWRIGYVAGPTEAISGMKKIQSHSTSGACAIAQYAALEALTMDQSVVTEFRDTYHQRYQIAFDALSNIPGIKVIPTFATFYLFLDVQALIAAKSLADDIALCHALLEEANVAVVPGTAFGTPGHVRMSLALATPLLEEALTRLNNYCNT